MEVILREAIEKLGHPGDIVKVSAGYARNFLLPRGKAYEVTAGNKTRIAQEKATLEAAENARRTTAEEFAAKIEPISLTFAARVGEEGKLFGSVTNQDIEKALAEQGFSVERRRIRLEDPIKSTGEHTVPVHLSTGVNAHVTVIVEAEE